ncbi:PE-PGRS family domain protein [Mycobacterium ulcerans str. Harvey]|uniref:PE-PGRS family domain protein n=1 Tax=Mycobacterium ulcerans str. Harvey TaxID=1299332 RepID=A0ABN0QLY4_MYCUL|nr:PE-PGRS family domain protein [Mycobacterium ulcerans str. Harvey]
MDGVGAAGGCRPTPDESQGEAIAFHPDGNSYVTVSEGQTRTCTTSMRHPRSSIQMTV